MITASVVLYKNTIQQVNKLISSYSPSENRILFVIDNSPKYNAELDFLKERAGIEYIFAGRNAGYGAGHNIGITRSIELNADYHIVLNPDLYFDPEIIESIAEYMNENISVISLMPKIFSPEGKLQYLCKMLPTPLNFLTRRFLPMKGCIKDLDDRFTLREFGYDSIINPPFLSGCFMFLRVSMIKKFNLFFDERFFMYCEDVDFSRRMHRYGKTVFYPYVSVVHEHSRESYKSIKMLLVHLRSAVRYLNKYGWFYDSERTGMNREITEEIKAIKAREVTHE